MLLNKYAIILKRWWYLLVLPTVLVTLLGLSSYRLPQDRYVTTIRFSAAVFPDTHDNNYQQFDKSYYSWLSSEYLVSGLADWIVTGSFADSVNMVLAEESVMISADIIQGSINSDYVRSEVLLYVNSDNSAHTMDIAKASIKVMQEQNASVFPQLGGYNAQVIALDKPNIVTVPPNVVQYLQPLIRIMTGIVLGILMVCCAHYLDPFVRNRYDIERIGIKVIVEL
ncbi:MAG TPA: hypothetical protein DCL76_02720 [Chloroflexi bacterium]|nr:hypothetical protein [Chloroflexota bacterium]HCU98757.1 hypothetical protein [Chloroflexota bacterium]|tara:strand:+ start:7769 stop:8443 length:675 start_codon:yes stop_codon:yes gene_type:complete